MHTLGSFPLTKETEKSTNTNHHQYKVPSLFPDPTSTATLKRKRERKKKHISIVSRKSPQSSLFFKHLVCILLWYMNICIYYKYIFYKEIWIQIQQKCDNGNKKKEGCESDHPNMNYCTDMLSTVATGPIGIKTPLSWLLSFSINHLLMPCLQRNGRPVWSANSTEWRTCCFLRPCVTSLKCLDFLTFNQPLNIRWNSPAAGYKPWVYLSFINHILLLLPFTGPMYLFPSSPHAHHCRKAHGNIDGECVQTFFDAYCSLEFEL